MKVAIIGAGHNGLVCASYLAQAGLDVTVFEKRDLVGGLCVTEELIAGFKVSSVASYYGMLRREVAEELDLEKYGLKPYLTDPVEIVMLPGGKFVFTPREGGDAKIELGEVSQADLDGWRRFWGDMSAAARVVYPKYFDPETTQADVVAALRANNLDTIADYIFAGSLLELLGEYLDNESFMAAAATCTPGFANKVGSVFGCIHHGTASTCGEFGAWGFVKAGMGEITQAMRRAAEARGVKIRTNSGVRYIGTEDGAAKTLRLETGEELQFDLIVANTDPFTLYEKLLSSDIPSGKAVSATAAAAKISDARDYARLHEPNVSAGKVHFALSRLPKMPILESIGHNYAGVIVSAPSIQTVIKDSVAVPNGKMPERLMLTMGFPSVTDNSVAPEGQHLFTVDIHYLPAKLNGKPWTEADKQMLVDAVLRDLQDHSPDLEGCIIGTAAVTPGNLETTYNLRGASCWHLPMTPEYLFEKRRFPGSTAYGTAFKNLYICGASTYPGGNVSGVPGRNCATQILTALKTPALAH